MKGGGTAGKRKKRSFQSEKKHAKRVITGKATREEEWGGMPLSRKRRPEERKKTLWGSKVGKGNGGPKKKSH